MNPREIVDYIVGEYHVGHDDAELLEQLVPAPKFAWAVGDVVTTRSFEPPRMYVFVPEEQAQQWRNANPQLQETWGEPCCTGCGEPLHPLLTYWTTNGPLVCDTAYCPGNGAGMHLRGGMVVDPRPTPRWWHRFTRRTS